MNSQKVELWSLITTRLNEKIQIGEKEFKLFMIFYRKNFLEELKGSNLPFINNRKRELCLCYS